MQIPALRLRLLTLFPGACTPHPSRELPRARAMQFHVSRAARDSIGFDDALFAVRGDVVFADVYAAHQVANAINAKRGSQLRAAQLHAMGLVHEIFHAVIALYRKSIKPDAFSALLAKLRADLGDNLDATLLAFVNEFPPPAVYRGSQTPAQFLAGTIDGVRNDEWVLEELVLLWLSNENPAYAPIRELVGDDNLRKTTAYGAVVTGVREFFDEAPRIGASNQSLVELLLAPIRHAPTSLTAQLEFMRARWGLELDALEAAFRRLLAAIDVLREENQWFMRRHEGPKPAPNVSPFSFEGEMYEAEPERFSPDVDWMPRVVMIAKSTFVWLDQLSKQYGREVRTLSDIPDEELDTLARRGFTALWLIGVWRRSAASRRIKQMQGNADAAASAYSLHDYEIAPEIGGDAAYRSLRTRAEARGLRLASDMVPNHMGIDSRWVVQHPDWFVQSDRPPFPGYSFTGADVGEDDRVGVYIEDGYWHRTDAAVVFKRLDKHTGQTRFIYHGNDGTSMPWNDTAQLDYLKREVREAVIQTILHVARMFPIIRFDAAMTLAKRHYQRLWFPLPGSGGDIPSRAEHAMTKEEFDRAFPVEFWREVVDRVAAEAPGTLLLAEAFWMMEGYFVRTLGMHRVYNSAFMNMLKREENAAFRTSVKNVLEYDARILERHVNFMNNPDEETAVAQFGKDDKYFGVATLMATMPGLPMFGHGQIEGFTEKYGMEYRRALKDERADGWLVDRHEREIFPLLRKRHLFSGIEGFTFYDFVAPEGHVDEDVIAYSNSVGTERTLVVYHNKYKDTRGRLRMSVGFRGRGENAGIEQKTLGDALGVHGGADRFVVYRDHVAALEYLRPSDEIKNEGMALELGAFKYHVLGSFREVTHTAEQPWRELWKELAGRGVPSADEALKDLKFKAIHSSLYEAIAPGSVKYLMAAWDPKKQRLAKEAARAVAEKVSHVVHGVAYLYESFESASASANADTPDAIAVRLQQRLEASLARSVDAPLHGIVVAWLFVEALRELYALAVPDAPSTDALEKWSLRSPVLRAMRGACTDEEEAQRRTAIVELLVRQGPPDDARFFLRALADEDARALLGVNLHEGVTWFHKESAERLVETMDACALVAPAEIDRLRAAIAKSGYRVDVLRKVLARDEDGASETREADGRDATARTGQGAGREAQGAGRKAQGAGRKAKGADGASDDAASGPNAASAPSESAPPTPSKPPKSPRRAAPRRR